MKIVKVENKHYKIEEDDDKGLLYLTLFATNTSKETDRNIVNNILSYCMQMPKRFEFILDLRYFDPRVKSEWFQHNMDRTGKRMNEINAGPQAHILNEMFWQKLWFDYPEYAGQKPVIFEDTNTKELIGRFDSLEEGEQWLEKI